MYGLEAINAHNGWAISLVGITIVFSGLVLLSLSIAQLHKILRLWDERDKYLRRLRPQNGYPPEPTVDIPLTQDILETAHQFKLISDRLGEPFPLPRLLKLSKKSGILKPHSRINDLLSAKLLVADGKGYYNWTEPVFKPYRTSVPVATPKLSPQAKEMARQLKVIIDWLGAPFSKKRVLEIARDRGLLQSDSIIIELMEVKIIIPDGTGLFLWDSDMAKKKL